MNKLILIPLLGIILFITGCGPTIMVATGIMGASEQKRCLKVNEKLVNKGLSYPAVRLEMRKQNCSKYL